MLLVTKLLVKFEKLNLTTFRWHISSLQVHLRFRSRYLCSDDVDHLCGFLGSPLDQDVLLLSPLFRRRRKHAIRFPAVICRQLLLQTGQWRSVDGKEERKRWAGSKGTYLFGLQEDDLIRWVPDYARFLHACDTSSKLLSNLVLALAQVDFPGVSIRWSWRSCLDEHEYLRREFLIPCSVILAFIKTCVSKSVSPCHSHSPHCHQHREEGNRRNQRWRYRGGGLVLKTKKKF